MTFMPVHAAVGICMFIMAVRLVYLNIKEIWDRWER